MKGITNFSNFEKDIKRKRIQYHNAFLFYKMCIGMKKQLAYDCAKKEVLLLNYTEVKQ